MWCPSVELIVAVSGALTPRFFFFEDHSTTFDRLSHLSSASCLLCNPLVSIPSLPTDAMGLHGCPHFGPCSLFERNDSLATTVVTCGPNAVLSIFGDIRHARATFLVRLCLRQTLRSSFAMFSHVRSLTVTSSLILSDWLYLEQPV